MDNFKEKENDRQGIDLQSPRKEEATERNQSPRTKRRGSSSGRGTSKETGQEVNTNTTVADMNGGTIGAQDYNTNNATGMYAGLWESKRIQLDSTNITSRAKNIIKANKNKRNKMTDSGQPVDTININPTLVLKPNYNPTAISNGV